MVSFSKAAICLHNFLRTSESAVYCPPGYVDGEDGSGNVVLGHWRNDQEESSGMHPVSRTGSNR